MGFLLLNSVYILAVIPFYKNYSIDFFSRWYCFNVFFVFFWSFISGKYFFLMLVHVFYSPCVTISLSSASSDLALLYIASSSLLSNFIPSFFLVFFHLKILCPTFFHAYFAHRVIVSYSVKHFLTFFHIFFVGCFFPTFLSY